MIATKMCKQILGKLGKQTGVRFFENAKSKEQPEKSIQFFAFLDGTNQRTEEELKTEEVTRAKLFANTGLPPNTKSPEEITVPYNN